MSDELLQFTAELEIQAAAATKGKPAKVEVLVYGGGIMTPSTSWGPTLIDTTGVQMAASVPLLADHVADLGGVLGAVTANVRNGQLIASGQIIPATESAKQVIELARGGFVFQASIGLQPKEQTFVRAGETVTANGRTHKAPSGGLTLISAGVLREVTLTALGADDTTFARIAAKAKETAMTQTTTTIDPAHANPGLNLGANDDNVAVLRARLTNDYIKQNPGRREAMEQLEAQADAESWDTGRLEMALLRAARPVAPSNIATSSPGGTDNDVLQASLMLRVGREELALKCFGDRKVEAARKARIGCMQDLCRAALKLDPRGSQHADASRDQMIKAAFSNVNLPTILSNVMGRVLEAAYAEATADVYSFASVRSAANFKEQTSIRPSAVETTEKVGATGEIKHTALNEEDTFTWSVETYARMVGITRQDIVNDDLSFFDTLPGMLAMASARKLVDLVYSTILGGETAGHYASGNGNLLTSSSALAIASLGTAIKTFKNQKDSQSNNIAITPRVLLTGPTLETTARALLNSTEIVTGEDATKPSGNPLRGIVERLVIAPQLENSSKFSSTSTTAWYLFGGPESAALVIGFLDGKRSPTVETEDAPFNTLGMQMRVYHDFGVALGDPKASQKNTGAS